MQNNFLPIGFMPYRVPGRLENRIKAALLFAWRKKRNLTISLAGAFDKRWSGEVVEVSPKRRFAAPPQPSEGFADFIFDAAAKPSEGCPPKKTWPRRLLVFIVLGL